MLSTLRRVWMLDFGPIAKISGLELNKASMNRSGKMTFKKQILRWRWFMQRIILLLTSLMALAFLTRPHVARAQNSRNCAWPIEISPEGYGNATMPENLARYFLMPFDNQHDTMTIKGTYPNVRYFSFVAYDIYANPSNNKIPGGLYDAQIAPDPGSVNPFVRPHKTTHPRANGVNGTYTVVISRINLNPTPENTIKVNSDLVFVLLRIYIPTPDPSLSGQSLIGGVPLPTILLDGNEVSPCSPANKLPDLAALLKKLFPVDLEGDEGTPSSDRLWFAPPKTPPMPLLPNPDNKYIGMLPGNNYQPGRIIVIHGKAPGTPDTYDGSPIWVPARGFRTVDMRYWSVCEGDLAVPVPAVNCTEDLTTDLQGGDYTIVISDDLLRPDWLRPNITWLPWGDENYFKVVFFRNMLPDPNFPFSIQKAMEAPYFCGFEFNLPNIPHSDDTIIAGQCTQGVMGDYYPVAVWCDKSTFVHGGWQACIK